jgi:hypothetical protein
MKKTTIVTAILLITGILSSFAQETDFDRLKKLETLEGDTVRNKLDRRKDTLSFRFGKKRYSIIKHHNPNSHDKYTTAVSDWNGFRGHWSGFGLGINNFFTNSSDFELPTGFMELNERKSIEVNINLFQHSFGFTRNVGVVTGLGLTYNNYRFENDITLMKSNGKVVVDNRYNNNNYSVEKTKLTTCYLNVPLLLEYNTRIGRRTRMHINAGLIGSLRIGSHTKVVYRNHTPGADNDRKKAKDRGDFYLRPFKYSLYGQVGIGDFAIYGKYDMVSLFEDNKGPELIPFSAGIVFTFF